MLRNQIFKNPRWRTAVYKKLTGTYLTVGATEASGTSARVTSSSEVLHTSAVVLTRIAAARLCNQQNMYFTNRPSRLHLQLNLYSERLFNV